MTRNRKPRRARVLSALAIAGATVVVGAAYAGSVSHRTLAQGSATASIKPTAAASNTLVLYQASGYAQAVANAFQKKTGITVDVVHLATGPLAAKIEAEGKYPQWDVAWFDDNTTMEALGNLGLLNTKWKPNDLNNYTKAGRKVVPANYEYFPMGYTAAAAMAYNTQSVPASQAPKTWQDLLNPAFKGAVAMNNPAISGPTYPFVAGILQQQGLKAGEHFFQELKNSGLQVYAKNGPTIQALVTGQAKVALAQDAALIGEKLQGAPIKIVYPKSGVYQLENVMGIAKNAPDKKAAEEFVQFCLTRQAQNIMSNPKNGGTDSYRTSYIKGVMTPPIVKKLTRNVKWINVYTRIAARRRTNVLNWFTRNIVQ